MTLAVASMMTAAVSSFPLMFAARIIAGLAAGIAMAGALAAVGRAWPSPDERNKKAAFVIEALAGGPGLMPPLLRLIAAPTNWHMAILVYAGIVGLIGVLALLGLPALEGTPRAGGTSLRSRFGESVRVFTLPVVGTLIFLRVLIWTGRNAIFVYLAGFFVAEYPGKEAWIGPVFAILSLGGLMIGSLTLGLAYSRLGGPLRVLVVSGLVFTASGVAFVWITPAPLVTSAFLLVWGFVGGLCFPAIINLLYAYSGRHQGAVIFTDSALQQTAAIAGAALGGLALTLTVGFVGWQVFVTLVSVATLLPLALVVRSVRADVAAVAA
jgi:predicted MFS family arabinose efflux permease